VPLAQHRNCIDRSSAEKPEIARVYWDRLLACDLIADILALPSSRLRSIRRILKTDS
jgi:hypothetical protein